MPLPSRDDAWALLCEYTESDSLRKHGRAVEQVMRTFAASRGEDEELFGIIGMLHDFDYEKYPSMEEHPMVGSKILAERGYPEEQNYVFLVGGAAKRRISERFQRFDSGGTNTLGFTVNEDATSKTTTISVNTIDSDFGDVSLVLNNFLGRTSGDGITNQSRARGYI
ncbi:MAG: HD domain-containing protein, partial [Candidatus Marinimicrobia bacterium]|nr:HD domain-containing protein [Candidatus Neomarinimicrobiota bacterium]